jgi:uncharacterized protein
MTDATMQADRPPPWGYFATLAWALLALVLSLVTILLIDYALVAWRQGVFPQDIETLNEFTQDPRHSFLLGILLCAIPAGVFAFAARLRHWSAQDYLGLIRPGRRDVMIALAAFILCVAVSDGISYLVDELVPIVQIDEYRNAKETGTLLLYWLDYLILAPVGEEIITRGFLQRGWARSPYSVAPGIAVISALWAAAHVQYDWFGIFMIFVFGLLLGWVRWRSGSTVLTVLLHAVANAWSGLQVLVTVEWLS